MKYSPEYENFKHDAKKMAKASREVSKSGAKLGWKLSKQGGKKLARLSETAYQNTKERRDTLKAETRRKLLIALTAGGIAGAGGLGYHIATPKQETQPLKIEKQDSIKKVIVEPELTSVQLLANKKFGTSVLQTKPEGVHLSKHEKQKNRLTIANLPEAETIVGKVMRCLRRKHLTDEAEKKYGIPSNLLLAMMAQEGSGDPTLPNILNRKTDQKTGKRKITKSDGGLGLIHIQGVNAERYGLKVLQTNPGKPNAPTMRDTALGAKILSIYEKSQDPYKLAHHDERRNPVLAVDVAARFLRECYEQYGMGKGKDGWIFALNSYSGRNRDDYAAKVIRYRTLLDQYTNGEKSQIPTFSKAIDRLVKDYQAKPERLTILEDSINAVKVEINGKAGTYQDYVNYFSKELDQFGFQAYKKHNPKAVKSPK